MIGPVEAILLTPLLAAAILAVLPGYRIGAALNVLACLVSLAFALLLLSQRPPTGQLSAGRRSQYRLCPVELLHRLHHQRLQRLLHRSRTAGRQAGDPAYAFLSRNVPADAVRHEPGAAGQQYRPDVGRGRTGDADHGADGRPLSHRRGAGGGVEIFHPRQRRHRSGAVRHHPGLSRRASGGRRGNGGDDLDHSAAARAELRSVAAEYRIHFPVAGIRHQGRAGAAACLAARRARRGTDTDLRRAVRPAAECRAVRAAAVQDAAGGKSARHRAGSADDRAGTAFGHFRRVHAVPAPRYQTAVRLLIHRAHGHHRVRLRRRRPPGQLRGPVADGDAQPDQVGDLLLGRPCGPGQRHPAHRRDRRPDGKPPGARLDPGRRRSPPSSACRRLAYSPASSC